MECSSYRVGKCSVESHIVEGFEWNVGIVLVVGASFDMHFVTGFVCHLGARSVLMTDFWGIPCSLLSCLLRRMLSHVVLKVTLL